MNTQKLTPWLPASINPVRDGVYQVMTPDVIGLPWLSEFRHGLWLGTVGGHDYAHASQFGREFGPTKATIIAWRGLAEQPK